MATNDALACVSISINLNIISFACVTIMAVDMANATDTITFCALFRAIKLNLSRPSRGIARNIKNAEMINTTINEVLKMLLDIGMLCDIYPNTAPTKTNNKKEHNANFNGFHKIHDIIDCERCFDMFTSFDFYHYCIIIFPWDKVVMSVGLIISVNVG